MERMYQSSALNNQNVVRRDSPNYRSVVNKILLAGTVLTGIAALATQTDLLNRAKTRWYNTASIERSTPANNYEDVPYMVKSGDTISRLAKDDPLVERYIMKVNKIRNDKELQSRVGDTISIVEFLPYGQGKTLHQLDELSQKK